MSLHSMHSVQSLYYAPSLRRISEIESDAEEGEEEEEGEMSRDAITQHVETKSQVFQIDQSVYETTLPNIIDTLDLSDFGDGIIDSWDVTKAREMYRIAARLAAEVKEELAQIEVRHANVYEFLIERDQQLLARAQRMRTEVRVKVDKVVKEREKIERYHEEVDMLTSDYNDIKNQQKFMRTAIHDTQKRIQDLKDEMVGSELLTRYEDAIDAIVKKNSVLRADKEMLLKEIEDINKENSQGCNGQSGETYVTKKSGRSVTTSECTTYKPVDTEYAMVSDMPLVRFGPDNRTTAHQEWKEQLNKTVLTKKENELLPANISKTMPNADEDSGYEPVNEVAFLTCTDSETTTSDSHSSTDEDMDHNKEIIITNSAVKANIIEQYNTGQETDTFSTLSITEPEPINMTIKRSSRRQRKPSKPITKLNVSSKKASMAKWCQRWRNKELSCPSSALQKKQKEYKMARIVCRMLFKACIRNACDVTCSGSDCIKNGDMAVGKEHTAKTNIIGQHLIEYKGEDASKVNNSTTLIIGSVTEAHNIHVEEVGGFQIEPSKTSCNTDNKTMTTLRIPYGQRWHHMNTNLQMDIDGSRNIGIKAQKSLQNQKGSANKITEGKIKSKKVKLKRFILAMCHKIHNKNHSDIYANKDTEISLKISSSIDNFEDSMEDTTTIDDKPVDHLGPIHSAKIDQINECDLVRAFVVESDDDDDDDDVDDPFDQHSCGTIQHENLSWECSPSCTNKDKDLSGSKKTLKQASFPDTIRNNNSPRTCFGAIRHMINRHKQAKTTSNGVSAEASSITETPRDSGDREITPDNSSIETLYLESVSDEMSYQSSSPCQSQQNHTPCKIDEPNVAIRESVRKRHHIFLKHIKELTCHFCIKGQISKKSITVDRERSCDGAHGVACDQESFESLQLEETSSKRFSDKESMRECIENTMYKHLDVQKKELVVNRSTSMTPLQINKSQDRTSTINNITSSNASTSNVAIDRSDNILAGQTRSTQYGLQLTSVKESQVNSAKIRSKIGFMKKCKETIMKLFITSAKTRTSFQE